MSNRIHPLSFMLVVLLAACGGGEADANPPSEAASVATATAVEQVEPTTEPDTDTGDDETDEGGGEPETTEEDEAAAGGTTLAISASETCSALTFEQVSEVTGLGITPGNTPFSTSDTSCAYTMEGPVSVYVEVSPTVGAFEQPATPDGLEQYAAWMEDSAQSLTRIDDLGDGAVSLIDSIGTVRLDILVGDQYLQVYATPGQDDQPATTPEAIRTLAESLLT